MSLCVYVVDFGVREWGCEVLLAGQGGVVGETGGWYEEMRSDNTNTTVCRDACGSEWFVFWCWWVRVVGVVYCVWVCGLGW